MGASMEMALNSFSSEEQTLVLLASVFESRPIPEIVFKILFKSVHSSLAKFSKSSELLERSNFLELESVSGNAIWGNSQRSWSIHTMRQKYISGIKEKEIDLIFTKLCQQVEHNNITALLLVMYGQVPWCDKAASQLGIPRKQFEDNDITQASFPLSRVIEPFVWLLNGEPQDEREKQSHQSAIEIIHKYLHSIELDDISISNLLEKPEMFSTTCQALFEMQALHHPPCTFKIRDTFLNPLTTLVGNLVPSTSPQLQQVVIALRIICTHQLENALKIGSFPHVVERLVAFLDNGVQSETQQQAAWALGQISHHVVENAMKIGSFPHAVERLVALLDVGVLSKTKATAAWALGQISKNVMENAVKIGSFPHAVERLVALLNHGVASETQQRVAWALGQISSNVLENAVKIGSFPHALERLVALLDNGVASKIQPCVAWALGQISRNVVENSVKIGSFPHAMERLVALLDDRVRPKAQKYAATTLGIISGNVVENATNIGSFPHAVKRLVALLDNGVQSETQEEAALALGQISKNVVENAMKIGSLPHAMERLVALLDIGVRLETKVAAAWALGQISKNVVENAMKIGSSPHALERLVDLLDNGVPSETQEKAAWALGQISKNEVKNAMKIGSLSHAMERLVALLHDGVRSETQEKAMWALGQISENVMENAMKIGSLPHAMERLVRLLVKNGEDYNFQMSVIICLWSISFAVGENQLLLKSVFMENPSCIEMLASCASSKAQGNGLGQYFGAQVYHLLNVSNGKEIKYESSKAYEGRGDFKVRKEDYVGALGDYENGLAIDKEDLSGNLHRKRSFVKAKLGDFQGALEDANEFLRIRNDCRTCRTCRSYSLQERGILKRLTGDLPGALADLDEALHLDTDDYEMLKHRGLVKFLLNDVDGARADAEWALRVKPARVDAYSYGRCVCLGTSSVEYLGYKLK